MKINTEYISCAESICIFGTTVAHRYPITQEGWYSVILTACYERIPNQPPTYPVFAAQGSVSFHNPYGYLPAEGYGLLPFEALRAIAFLLLIAYYILHYTIHNTSVILLHRLLFGLAIIACLEALACAGQYLLINYTGTPLCCPYSLSYISLTVFQVINSTVLRLLLLLVSLGYGIGRPKLMNSEVIAIVALHVIYFTATVSNELYYFAHQSSGHLNTLVVFVTVINAMLLSWIYISLTYTIRILKEFQQTEKLKLYRRLLNVVLAFIVMLAIITGMMLLDDHGVVEWPWQLDWTQQAAFEIVNLAIVGALLVLFKPTARSHLLAYTSQLPMEDPDEDEEMPNITGLRLGRDARTLYDEEELEMVNIKAPRNSWDLEPNRKVLHAGEVDDEYGLSDGSD